MANNLLLLSACYQGTNIEQMLKDNVIVFFPFTNHGDISRWSGSRYK